MKKADIEAFYANLQKATPEPKGELHYVNSYALLVAVVLSAQATDVGVNKATGPLFAAADTPEMTNCSLCSASRSRLNNAQITATSSGSATRPKPTRIRPLSDCGRLIFMGTD